MQNVLINPYIDKAQKYNLILNYYRLVDSKNIEEYRELYDLYSDIAIYDRSGIKYFGKKKIISFFETRFNILDIKHSIKKIKFFDDGDIFVEGKFDGEKNGKNIYGDFIDTFKINNGKIIYRKTDLIVNENNSGIIQID